MTEPHGYANPGSPQGPPPARTGTMVWGLVAVLVGLGAIAVATGRRVDLEIALISLFIIAGFGLLIGSAVSALRSSSRERKGGQGRQGQ
ncbi:MULTISPECIES: hypothetical protein [unclassified Pseudactinotalea]|uniref:hypothetical protein n=1 Tax=Micrococcales TaxID=85006 RepID=UPI003C7AE3E4